MHHVSSRWSLPFCLHLTMCIHPCLILPAPEHAGNHFRLDFPQPFVTGNFAQDWGWGLIPRLDAPPCGHDIGRCSCDQFLGLLEAAPGPGDDARAKETQAMGHEECKSVVCRPRGVLVSSGAHPVEAGQVGGTEAGLSHPVAVSSCTPSLGPAPGQPLSRVIEDVLGLPEHPHAPCPGR